MIKELKDTLALYEKSTDPTTKMMYYDLIVRLRSLLGWEDTAAAATGPQSGGGGGDGDGVGGDDATGEDEVADSDDETE